MRIRAHSRLLAGSRKVVPVAALVSVLALIAACGGGSSGSGGSGGAMSADKLTHAVVSAKDLDHLQVVPASSKGQLLGAKQTTDPASCQPIADQWSSAPRIARQVYTGAIVTDTAAKDKNAKTISLEVVAAYRPGQAKQVLDALTASVDSCKGYKVTRNGRTSTFTVKRVEPATGAKPAGDQQVSYTVTDPALGAAGVALVTVVRTGETTAAFETVRADHKTASLRQAIVQKQVGKLQDAAAGK